MRIYLAGVHPWRTEGLYDEAIKKYSPFILDSFYYCENSDTASLLPFFGDFMLDSGVISSYAF